MRIELPFCGFHNCRHYFDGNCSKKIEYEKCEYRIARDNIALKMDKQRISDIIYNTVDYMYCDNCRYHIEMNGEWNENNPCYDCVRKENGWAISRAESDQLASKISDI